MEVWLIENHYTSGVSFEEIALHLPGTDIWLLDTGAFEEHIEQCYFTASFWNDSFNEHLLTKLGNL